MKRSSAIPKEEGVDTADSSAKRQRQTEPKEGDSHAAHHSKPKQEEVTKGEQEPSAAAPKSEKIPYQDLLKGKNRHRLPDKIMRCLMQGIEPDVLWWSPHDNGFTVDSEKVQAKLLDVHFRGTKLSSLVRSLNRWGFRRDFYRTLPKRALAFQHSQFQKDAPHLLTDMKIIASTTQEVQEDSSDSDEAEESEEVSREDGNPNAKRTSVAAMLGPANSIASPKLGMRVPLSQQQNPVGLPSGQVFPVSESPAGPMVQSLLHSETSRLPQSFLQVHPLRQSSAIGPGHAFDHISSQFNIPRQSVLLQQSDSGLQASQLQGSNSFMGQALLPSSSTNLNPMMPSSFTGLSSGLASAALLRAAQSLHQPQQHQPQQGSPAAVTAYLQAFRGAEGARESSLLGGHGMQDQRSIQARLLAAAATGQQSDDDLRLAQLAEQYRQGDHGVGRSQTSNLQQAHSSLLSPHQQQQLQQQSHQQLQQSSLLPQQQQLLSATLERDQVNSQIQALLQQMQRRQAGLPGDNDEPTGGS